jgi:tetrahydromethanopterin S-methyltransferase subunit C
LLALSGRTAKRIVLLLARLAARLPLTTLLLLAVLRQLFAKVAHPFAQRFHGLGLLVYRLAKIIAAQRLLGPFHGALGPFQRLARGLSGLAATTGHRTTLLFQLAAQRFLAVGQ